jgi:hypothetical protein
MDFRERCQEANRIDMVDYLASQGYQPTKVRGHQYWYQSMLPDRVDGTASFKVNRNRNQWYDFGAIGAKKGGSLIDFAIAYHGWSISECLQYLSDPLASNQIVPRELSSIGREPEHKIIILEDKPIRSERLILYLRNRRIPLDVAQQYCREVKYQFKDKAYYSIGFKNDLGGYELRNEFYKNSSSPKGLTFINNGVEDVTSFEGFFDFLSFAAIHRNQEIPLTNYLMDIEDNFLTIKEDIIDLVDGMISQMQRDPEMSQLIVNKIIPEKKG